MTEPLTTDVAEAVRLLAAAGIVVDEDQAREALSVSREAASARHRALVGGLEPMIAFDPRWRR
jgi:hypothetical protein